MILQISTFHLLDLNTKKRIHQYIAQDGGRDAVWHVLKEGLNKCKNATTENELQRLWDL